uniref:Uncharacterized protein n=1 Tax=Arion vulgaris TaxID=1028688 RepID=A0A0B7AI17_9EUPU
MVIRASYIISLLIAKSESHPIQKGEELILPAVSEVLNTVLHKSPHDIIKKISVSNNLMQLHINEIPANVEDTLCSILQTTEFALQLD